MSWRLSENTPIYKTLNSSGFFTVYKSTATVVFAFVSLTLGALRTRYPQRAARSTPAEEQKQKEMGEGRGEGRGLFVLASSGQNFDFGGYSCLKCVIVCLLGSSHKVEVFPIWYSHSFSLTPYSLFQAIKMQDCVFN